jgi:hypothetical protein
MCRILRKTNTKLKMINAESKKNRNIKSEPIHNNQSSVHDTQNHVAAKKNPEEKYCPHYSNQQNKQRKFYKLTTTQETG